MQVKKTRTETAESDQQIIQRILEGHTDDFRYLLQRYRQQVVAFVAHISLVDIEDVVQDVFVGVFRSLPTYSPSRSSFGTWINRIAYRVTMRHLRKHSQPFLYLEENEQLMNQVRDNEVDDYWQHAQLSEAERIDKALSLLKPEERLLVHLYYFEQQSLTNIAYTFSCEAGTLATRLCRIRKKLYVILQTPMEK